METFTAPRTLVENPRYSQDRRATLDTLHLCSIDEPIVDIIHSLASLPECFTLQSCYGHFLRPAEEDLRTLDPVPAAYQGLVNYRIAYLALCIQNNLPGQILLESLRQLTEIDPAYVQFGSADWFWERWYNSYALQVEPVRYSQRDEVTLQAEEAIHVQQIRGLFFAQLRRLISQILIDRREK